MCSRGISATPPSGTRSGSDSGVARLVPAQALAARAPYDQHGQAPALLAEHRAECVLRVTVAPAPRSRRVVGESHSRGSRAEFFDDFVGSIEQHLLDVGVDAVDLLAAA